MKNKLFYALFAALMIVAFSSCKDKSASEDMPMEDATLETMPVEEELGKEHTSTYICPMHCEGSGSEEPGVCPVCQMEYVMNRKLEESHEGHDHGPEGHEH